MRRRICVILLCMLLFVVFVRQKIQAQTAGFSKISPGWNQTLWKTDYTYTWTFSWKPYSGGAVFDHYSIKFYNNSTFLKEIVVPGGKTATSMVVDFTNMTEIAKGNNYYSWTLGAYNGSNTTPVALADSMPSSSGTTSSFRVPLYTTTTKTWSITTSFACPPGMVNIRKIRPFTAAWIEGQDHPQNFYWKYGDYSISTSQTTTVNSRTANDTLYLGLESDQVVTKKLYYGGTTSEPQELIPTGQPWASNMNDAAIYEGTWFNPYTAMVAWRSDNLPSGNYKVAFAIPTPYQDQWCIKSCADSDNGHIYTTAGTVTGGYNTCPGGNCTDSCSGTSVNEWYCEDPLHPKQETLDCPSGSCTGGACAPGICIPTLGSPQNNARVTTTDPVVTWTQCTGSKYSQINITGSGVDKTITTPADTKSFTLTGLGFQTNNTYTWKVRACNDAACSNAGNWSTANTFRYYVCTKSTGDADCENGTDDNDFTIWKCEYFGRGTCTSSNPPTTNTADFDGKDGVTLVDFEIWRSHRY